MDEGTSLTRLLWKALFGVVGLVLFFPLLSWASDAALVSGTSSLIARLGGRGYTAISDDSYTLTRLTIGPMAPDLSRGPFLYLAAPDSSDADKALADVVEVGAAMDEIQDAIDTLATACVTACGTVVLMPGTHNLGNTPSAIITGARMYVLMKDGVDLTGYGSDTVVTITDATDYPDDVQMFHASPGTDAATWGVDDVRVSRITFDQTAAPTPVTNNRHPLAFITTNAVYSYLWFLGGEEEIQTSENVSYGRFIPSDNYYHHIRCENTSAACVELQRSSTNVTLEDAYFLDSGYDECLSFHMEAFSGGVDERPTNITMERISFESTQNCILGYPPRVSVSGVNGMTVTDVVMSGMNPTDAWRWDTTVSGGTRIEDVTVTRVHLAAVNGAMGTGRLYRIRGDIVNIRIDE